MTGGGKKGVHQEAAGVSRGFWRISALSHHSGEGMEFFRLKAICADPSPLQYLGAAQQMFPGPWRNHSTGHAGSSVLALGGVSKLPLKELGLEDTENKRIGSF